MIFQALVSLLNRQREDDSRRTEHLLVITFTAPTPYAAALAVKRFADNRLKQFNDDFEAFTAVKIYEFTPAEIGADGGYQQPPAGIGALFEWKHDHPGSFAEAARTLPGKPPAV